MAEEGWRGCLTGMDQMPSCCGLGGGAFLGTAPILVSRLSRYRILLDVLTCQSALHSPPEIPVAPCSRWPNTVCNACGEMRTWRAWQACTQGDLAGTIDQEQV